MNRLVYNLHTAVKTCLEKILAMGFKRVGLAIFRVTDTNTDRNYLTSYLLFQFEQPVTERIPILLYDDLGERGYEMFLKWYKFNQPDVVLGSDDVVYRWLLRAGVAVPGECGFANLSIRQGDTTEFSGMYENATETGFLAAEMVVSALHFSDRGLPKIARDSYVQASWRNGITIQENARTIRKK